ncbi:G-box-binding factor-like [Ctenocephalides felis]|uniref:G-box-binding factor-like n=1 Tax=Ctenocephalides felis TaxID=7515 RepID=UPI000E6E1EBF|nr:G-box-binding factor-like [Ctenocephalides felis]
MSSKRKSPPTKLEGGGVACEQQQTNHHQNHNHSQHQTLQLQHQHQQDQQHHQHQHQQHQHHSVNCESSASGNGPSSGNGPVSDGDPGSDRDAGERSPTPPRLSGPTAPDSCPSTPSEGTTPTPATTPNTTPTPIANNVDSDSEGPCKKQRLEDTLARQSALLGLHIPAQYLYNNNISGLGVVGAGLLTPQRRPSSECSSPPSVSDGGIYKPLPAINNNIATLPDHNSSPPLLHNQQQQHHNQQQLNQQQAQQLSQHGALLLNNQQQTGRRTMDDVLRRLTSKMRGSSLRDGRRAQAPTPPLQVDGREAAMHHALSSAGSLQEKERTLSEMILHLQMVREHLLSTRQEPNDDIKFDVTTYHVFGAS